MNPALRVIRLLTVTPETAGETTADLTDDQWNAHADSVAAALTLAAQRHFAGKDAAEIITWVADVRYRARDLAGELDPLAAERVLRAIITGEESLTDGINGNVFADLALAMVPELLRQASLSATELDAFFTDADRLAEQWTGSER